MGKVLKADASVADAWVEINLGADHSEGWLSYRLALDATTFAFLSGGVDSGYFSEYFSSGHSDNVDYFQLLDFATFWQGRWGGFSTTPTPAAATWVLVETRYVTGGASQIYLDGTLAIDSTNTEFFDVRFVRFGQDASTPGGGSVYIDDVKVGTSRGGSDLFADDFESGTLAAWTSTSGDVSVVDDPFAPRTVAIRLYDPPLWRGIITNLAGRTLTNLDSRAAQRSFVYARNKPTTATGLVATDDPEINLPFPDLDSPARLSHNTRLIYWLRRESGATPPYVSRESGLVMQIEDVAADTPTARYTTFDSWQILMSRPVRDPDTGAPTGATYTDQRGSDIAMDLLANTVLLDGDVLLDFSDLSRIHDTPIITGKVVFEPGLSVGEAWTRLTDTGTIDIYLKPIYDPTGRPGKLVELHILPELGSIRYDAVFGWGMGPRNITSLSRLIDGTQLANEVQFYAGDAGAPVPLQTDPASVAEFGEYWTQQFNVGGSGQADLVELAALAELEKRRNGARSISWNPAPERSPLVLRDYGLGDDLPLYLPRDLREPLAPNLDYPPVDFQRAEQITIALNDDGVENVTVQTAGDAED